MAKFKLLVTLLSVLLLADFCLAIPSYGLSFQSDGWMNDDSVNVWAHLLDPIGELVTFSVCTWVKFAYERIFNQIWSYCVELPTSTGGKQMVCSSLAIEPEQFTMDIAGDGQTIPTLGRMRNFRWNLICGTYKTQGDRRMVTTLYLNGEKVYNTTLHDTEMLQNRWHAAGTLILGQDQDEIGGGFEKQQSLSGTISNLNIWSTMLTDNEILRMSKCFDSPLGNVLDWNAKRARWNLSMVVEEDLDTSDFCIDFPSKNYYLFPERRSLESGATLCAMMNGSVSIPLSNTENDLITQLSEDFYIPCEAEEQSGKTTWIGIEPTGNGRWMDMVTKEPILYTNFREGQGGGRSNCAYLFTGEETGTGKWGATFCSDQSPRRVCTVCEFNAKKVMISLRGLCEDSRHDRVFTLEEDGTMKPFFKGLSTSIIKWNETAHAWHLDHLRYRAQAFWNDETKVEYPLGRREWIEYDRRCDSFTGENKLFTFTTCTEEQFTCSDGTCVDLELRCDLKADCLDRSDEEACSKVLFKDDYESDLAPKHTINGERVNDPLPVYLGITILSFDKIDTVNMMLSVMMRINITWRDRRVDFLNLRDDIYQNIIPQDEFEKMWIPEIGFYNAKTGPLEKDEHEALMIRRDSDPEPFDSSRAREDYVYEGYKNSLMYLRRYYAEYHCTFNLRSFPFDRQACKMEFKARTVTKKYLILQDGGLTYRGPTSLIEFIITNYTMEKGRENVTRSELKVVINMERQYAFHITQSIFQSWLQGVLAYLTFYIDVNDFSDRFMGSLTVLLVLASLMSTLSESLPKTSYFKLIDFWLLFFLLSTALNIGMHIWIDILLQREEDKKEKANVVNKWVEAMENNDTTQVPKGKMAWMKATGVFKGMTAKKLNNIQKWFFPALFFIFLLGFSLGAYIGNLGEIDVDGGDI